MKFAAISDIHGNYAALEAVLADIQSQGIVDVVNLGDHLSGPLEAGRTADLLIEKALPSIRGNHDRLLVELQKTEMGESDAAAFAQLNEKHLDWLKSLPPTMIYRDDVFMCHGTPSSDTTYWMEKVTSDAQIIVASVNEIEGEAKGISCSLILCGHTHIPRVVRLRDGKTLVNPGSVECPAYDDDQPIYHHIQTGTPNASYAILERTPLGWSVSLRSVPYNNLVMSRLAETNGRQDWANALATGWLE